VGFIIDVLGKLCCPARDKDILLLKNLTRPSEIFQGILEVMEKMQMDLANFFLQQYRPLIINQCVAYERKKFADHLEMQYRLDKDGLRITREWILRHQDRMPDFDEVLGDAYVDILEWSESDQWPEVSSVVRILHAFESVKNFHL